MRPDSWHLTEDLDDFLARAGDFLRSRPALHNTPLTVIEELRTRERRNRELRPRRAGGYSADGTVFGLLEAAGEVRAACYRPPSQRLTLTPLLPEQADSLAAHLAAVGGPLTGVLADFHTVTAFAGAWQRRTGAESVPGWRACLHRLGTLTPPEPPPEGRGRLVGEQDRDQLIRLCGEFSASVGEVPAVDAGTWAGSRFAGRRFTFWETPDGAPVSMAAVTSMIAGMVRVDPVYTPAHLRGRGYAGALVAEVSRAAQAEGATDVVLFADPANPTSAALYRRIGYVPVADFAACAFSFSRAADRTATG